VGISLVEEANHLVLTVGDNGLGIRERDISNPRSLGLLGMRERALMFSGELKISGVHRKGTTVTVTIPTKKT
jgi:signal transduction histidine kinase